MRLLVTHDGHHEHRYDRGDEGRGIPELILPSKQHKNYTLRRHYRMLFVGPTQGINLSIERKGYGKSCGDCSEAMTAMYPHGNLVPIR